MRIAELTVYKYIQIISVKHQLLFISYYVPTLRVLHLKDLVYLYNNIR